MRKNQNCSNKLELRIAMVIGIASFYVTQSPLSHAQERESVQKSSDSRDLEEIIVTARLREERLQDIPLAINAFSATEIENAGIAELGDIASLTPAMQFNARSDGEGRVNSVVELRGVNQGSADHLQAASVFVDGVYVLGTANSLPLHDVERVEVIKGPQSAFFGRNTFAGAVNFITKSPDLNEFETEMDMLWAMYDHYDASISTSGPLVPGKLAYQLSARLYHTGGQWVSTDGGTLGQEGTGSLSGVLYGEPTDGSTVKLRVHYQEDEDGPPSAGYLRGRFDDTCSGESIQRFDSDGNLTTFFPTDYICGEVPEFGHVETITGRTILSSDTSLQPAIMYQDREGFIAATGEQLIGPQPNAVLEHLGGDEASEYLGHTVPALYKMGLKREQIRVSLESDYEFGPGYKATFLSGYNESRLNRIYDYDAIDGAFDDGEFVGRQWYATSPKYGLDWSAEARLASPQDGRLRWLVGATYYEQTFLSGSKFVATCWTSCDIGPAILTLPPTEGNEAKVGGIFGAISFDILDDLTVDLEARYLEDERTVALSGQQFTNTFYQFTPRVIVSFRPTETTTIYGQVSRGVLPGTTNSFVATCSPEEFTEPFVDPFTGELSTASECDQMRAQMGDSNFKAATESQELQAIEVGWKQLLLDGRVNLNLTAWQYDWENRPFGVLLVFFRDAEDPAERDGVPLPFPNNSSQNISGSQELYGVEFEAGGAITENWQAQLNVSWSKNKFTQFEGRDFERITGVTNYRGLWYEGYPEWMSNLSVAYNKVLSNEWEWYARSDFEYRGKYYAENLNLARGPDYLLTHIRAGLLRENLRVELFVRNLFDTDDWRNAVTESDFTDLPLDFQTIRGILVQPQQKRTVGVRVSMEF